MAEALVNVEKFRDLTAAMIARSLLESDGIQCFLQDENFVRMDWGYSQFIGWIRLQVAPADLERGRELLAAPIPEELDVADGEEPEPQPRCPQCGSLDVSHPGIRKGWSYFLLWLGFPVPVPSDRWHCESCRVEWIDDGKEAEVSL